jgi:hypothetical protein
MSQRLICQTAVRHWIACDALQADAAAATSETQIDKSVVAQFNTHPAADSDARELNDASSDRSPTLLAHLPPTKRQDCSQLRAPIPRRLTGEHSATWRDDERAGQPAA